MTPDGPYMLYLWASKTSHSSLQGNCYARRDQNKKNTSTEILLLKKINTSTISTPFHLFSIALGIQPKNEESEGGL